MLKKEQLKALLLALLTVLMLGWIVSSSEQFQKFVHDHKHNDTYQALYKSPSRIRRAYVRLSLNASAVGSGINDSGAGVTAIATIALVFSTVLLWGATKRMVEAGDRQHALTNRAFVYCSSQSLDAVEPTAEKDYVLSVEWKNTGKTWTKDAVHYVCWYAPEVEIDQTFSFNGLSGAPGSLFIGPDGTKRGGPFIIPFNYIKEVAQGIRPLYVWGWCEYDDIFPGTPRHRSEFCVKATIVAQLTDASDGRKGVTVVFMHYGEHNGADEDCMKIVQTRSRKNPL